MLSRWNDTEAQSFIEAAEAKGQPAALGLRVYTSRLIGQEPDLVLHGGGNTSVKIMDAEGGPLIHVKGSGWDLGDIEAPGLPAMHLEPLLKTRDIPHMSDEDMVALLRANLLDQSAPTPSIEALLHAYMPHNFVDHTHATASLALADQSDMEPVMHEIYGNRVAFVPYVMPGYSLSHACNDALKQNPDVEGLWLAQHGLFTFADTARGSYELMIEFVTMAEDYLAAHGARVQPPQTNDRDAPEALTEALRQALAAEGSLGEAPCLDFRSTPSIRTYLARENLEDLAQRGTATPDHVIRIKPFSMVLNAEDGAKEITRALSDFAARYKAYFDRNAPHASEEKIMLDPLPRSVLVRGVGLYGLGANEKAAKIAGDLMEQTTRIVNAAEDYKRFTPLAEADLFDMEYWSLEQAKLRK
ncbi:class II aldolase/adducin family protein [Celeribacter halophilus]|uniref:Rhamnose utilisation protein RhaD, predicted bifunctional aldolase and dehydrogenase n=1 Tax=Celeribacter halophilus TaxID=576117 RepID=A0A1I3WIA4_9RHOB|nr:class II aldolase/adducin family protein [Celeribacter halophilus]PZX09844.1 rhamnose utilization protein RhaD (predicted bifunctional aldolase and dehydrogenase) [Celeribacter halophilus]SFK06893.1 Rhamnose utilisation protein RhaD, predicted bifunctional aldolase and dehydrogenase [Celeribacter halophilus]